MQGGVGHGPKVDPEAKLVGSEILGQGHVRPPAIGCLPSLVCVPSWVEVTGEFIPHVSAADALVVDPVGGPVDGNIHFGDVWVEIAFGVPGARIVGVDEQQEDTLERPALWVYPKVNPGVAVPCNGNHLGAHDEVVGELLAAGVNAGGLVGQTLAPDSLVLQLDVFQLVHELACVRASHHLGSGSEGEFEDQIVVEGLRVENSVVGQNRVVQVDAVLVAVDALQLVFLIHTGGLLVASARANLAQIHTLDALRKHVGPLVRREKQVLEDLVDVVPIRVLDTGGGKLDMEPAHQGPGHVLHEIVVRMAPGEIDVKDQGQRS